MRNGRSSPIRSGTATPIIRTTRTAAMRGTSSPAPPEHRLVLAVIPGARTVENAEAIVAEAKRRLGGRAPDLITTDELPAYKAAIEIAFSEPVPTPTRRGPGRPRVLPERRLPDGLNYATVHKNRQNNRVVSVERRQIFGSPEGLGKALARSAVSVRLTPFRVHS
jgi:hypothetical protein